MVYLSLFLYGETKSNSLLVATGVSLSLSGVTSGLIWQQLTQVTLELGLLESKKSSVRVSLPITPVWANEQ